MIPYSELIINPDGSIYHLGLLPSQVPEHIITVGDPDRVDMISNRFNHIHFKTQVREFKSVLGSYNNCDILVLSTGIGTDNIDIVMTELDACVNIDFDLRIIKENKRRLRIFRIGTSGSLVDNIPIGSFLLSSFGVGLGGMMNYYSYAKDSAVVDMEQQLNTYLSDHLPYISAYVGKGDDHLIDSFDEEGIYKGVTLTAPGFYGPQGRNIRIQLNDEDYISKLMNCQLGQNQITNLEMETAGIYAMANALGHQAISLNALLANRKTGEFAKDPQKIVSELIDFALNKIINS